MGGKPYLIGGIREFWEHICHYYGVESFLSDDDIALITEENMRFYDLEEQEKREQYRQTRHICITGAYNPLTTLLLPELLEIETLPLKKGIKVYLHDKDCDLYCEESPVYDFFSEIAEDLENVVDIAVAPSLKDVMGICDLLIVINSIVKEKDETDNDWLMRALSYAYILSDTINAYAKRSLRVVLANEGPICLIAMAMIQACPRIQGYNIVAVTCDVGLKYLEILSEETKCPLDEISAPPVWGFIGLNEFVDFRSIVIKCDMLLPYSRASKLSESSLPLGTVQTELRYAGYLFEDEEPIIYKTKERREAIAETLKRSPIPSKVRAIISLLKLWYTEEKRPNKIISLGIYSNGSFNLPRGLVFSQPSKLTEGRWLPFTKFPISQFAENEIKKLLPPVLDIVDKFGFVLEKESSISTLGRLTYASDYESIFIGGG